ncbi:hypothetical protein CWC18_00935 [Pseudoalteromonas aurantia]|uniref:hypothetical protein n=1 Tax=Pseudoalteromonas aurantia TaxID=43654 RepID=UPI00110ACAA4|nr:hypothetical protein [Pseudoalteromonas aurantia]TMO67248.1 hypothetical protein CWC18_00935 [Pseudoalteromonas aurantia]
MKILLKINAGLIAPQLPDITGLFKEQSTVLIEGQLYLFANYEGDKQLVSDYDVELFIAQRNEETALKSIVIDTVSGQLDGYANNDNEFTVPQQSNEVIATGQLAISDRRFKVPFKRIDTGRIQLMPAQVLDGQFSIPLKFETNGIWIVNQELVNSDFQTPIFELVEYTFSVL